MLIRVLATDRLGSLCRPMTAYQDPKIALVLLHELYNVAVLATAMVVAASMVLKILL